MGCDVNEYIESDLLLQDPKEKGIFNMVRDWKSIHKLQELEAQKAIEELNQAEYEGRQMVVKEAIPRR